MPIGFIEERFINAHRIYNITIIFRKSLKLHLSLLFRSRMTKQKWNMEFEVNVFEMWTCYNSSIKSENGKIINSFNRNKQKFHINWYKSKSCSIIFKKIHLIKKLNVTEMHNTNSCRFFYFWNIKWDLKWEGLTH